MIGIFDSGVGGMSVMRAMVQVLPQEDMIYAADSANCPYGSRPQEEILHLSQRMTDFLIQKGSTIIVIACNTATAAAIDHLRRMYPHIAFVGTEPAVKPAAAQSQNKHIAVLATKGTFDGRLFKQTMHEHAKDTDVQIIVGEGLVELVEQGMENSPQAINLLQTLLNDALCNGIDTLVLGCTHFPFLSTSIDYITKGRVRLIDAAMPIAMQTKRLLEQQHLQNKTEHTAEYSFYTSGDINILQEMQQRHLNLLQNVRYGKL